MIKIRKSEERGYFDHGWLKTFHTFSFGDFHDEKFMHFESLRVINEDWVGPGGGFAPHSHRDMEIISYVFEGALSHKDSMGNGSTIQPGDVQFMSAGSGVTHSEFNHSKTDPVRLMQIWILPQKKGTPPRYQQKAFSAEEKRGKLCLLVSGDGQSGSIRIGQDAHLYSSILDKGEKLAYTPRAGKSFWLQVLRGKLDLNKNIATPGDALYGSKETELTVTSLDGVSEFLLFDL